MRLYVRASLLIALAIAVNGADAVKPFAFRIGTFQLVDGGDDALWTADTYTQNADGSFTGFGTHGGSAYTYRGNVTATTCAKSTNGTMSITEAWWYVDEVHTSPGKKRMVCTYVYWNASSTDENNIYLQHKSSEVPLSTELGECPATHSDATTNGISWMSGVTRGKPSFKCTSGCTPKPWDSCDKSTPSPSPQPSPPSPPPPDSSSSSPPGRIGGVALATVAALLTRLLL